jgi:hypothetical protein
MHTMNVFPANQGFRRPLDRRRRLLAVLLGLLALLPGRAPATGVGFATLVSQPTAGVGESVVVSGLVFYLDTGSWNPPWVVDMRFVTHHGSGSVVTSNLLSSPQPLDPWWPIQAQTAVTVQSGDPSTLLGYFVVVIDFDGTGRHVFTNHYPWQISVPDGVPPRLEMAALVGGGVAVSWPALYQAWQLEACDGPGLPWRAVAGPVVVEDGRCLCRLAPGNAGSAPVRLFRLSR